MDSRKVLVVSSIPLPTTADNKLWHDLAGYTIATQKRYCEMHGYDHHLDVSDVHATVRSPMRGDQNQGYDAPIRTMVKFELLQYFLDPDACRFEWDWVVWMDADCLVTNYEIPLLKFTNEHGAQWDQENGGGPYLGDVILAKDRNGLHPTVIMARASELTLDLMWACGHAGKTMFQQHDWNDIMAFRFFLATPDYASLVWYHPIKTLCASHPGAYPDHPKRTRHRYDWTPESLTLHLSALSLPRRIELAQEYVEKYKLLD